MQGYPKFTTNRSIPIGKVIMTEECEFAMTYRPAK